MTRIEFFCEDVDFKIKQKRVLKQWIIEVILKEGYIPGCINFILSSDIYLQELNYKYLKHRKLTDILTFPAERVGTMISGDIYISWERVQENAIIFKADPMQELHRVMIHGILHLVGYRDKSEQEKISMRSNEDSCLELLGTLTKGSS